jgi:cell division inhibitor SepF
MGAREYWDRMLVYFGITDELDADDVDDARPRGGSRRADTGLTGEWDVDDTAAPRGGSRTATARRGSARSGGRGGATQTAAGVGVVPPRTFNDAQKIADQFKGGVPVIVNLQQTDSDLAKRLIDFASGLTYGLDGGMQRIADKVFLLTPPNVEVSAEERAAMVEDGFFNQS